MDRDKFGRFKKGGEGRRCILNENNIIDLYLNKRLSLTKIAKLMNVSRTPLKRILIERGINIKKGYELDKETVIDLYKNKLVSPKKIARIFNCSTQPIYDILNKENLPKIFGHKILIKENKNPPNKVKVKQKQRDKIIHLYLKENKWITEISKELNISSGVIRRVLKENKIEIKSTTSISIDENKMIEEYNNTEITIKTIAKKYSVSHTVIYRILKKHKVKIRRKVSALKGRKMYEYCGWDKWLEIKEKLEKRRASQKFPLKNSSIEVKIQELLTKLHLEFYTHKYMHIKHGYQCDIFIPVQKGIPIKTVIECDGCYWHGCPLCREKPHRRLTKQKERDNLRTKELIEKGFRVIRLWEHEIKNLSINELRLRIIN